MFYILIALGFILRIILIPLPGFRADMAFWKGWGLAVADKGVLWLVKNTNYNYPPGFAYVLTLINKIYSFFLDPYNTNQYFSDTNLLYLFLIKIITIISDIVIVILIIKIIDLIKNSKLKIQNDNSKFKIIKDRFILLGKIAVLLYFLNPASIYDGVIWGQVDQFGLMLFLLSIYLLLIGRLNLAAVVFVVSCMMKFQNIIFIPLFYLYIFATHFHLRGVKEAVGRLGMSLGISFFTFLVIAFPFWVYKEGAALIRLLTINSDWFPYYSLNAFNFWWIASGLSGMQVIDKELVLGVLNAKQISLYLFIFGYFIACILLFFSKKEDLFKKFILSLSVVVFSFFHLLTQSHERYLFPLVALLPIYLVFLHKTERIKFFIFYSLFSILFFFNMYVSMFYNYPDQTIWPFTNSATSTITLLISVLQIIVFIYFMLVYVAKELKGKFHYPLALAALLLLVVAAKNFNYWLKKPISLLTLQPVHMAQEYLLPTYNKNLNSFFSPANFDRLSSNYFFYSKGIASHADSTIIYGLNGKFSRFKTDYGLDTEAGIGAEVYFIIEGDGRELFKSRVMKKFDRPLTADVDLKGVKNLGLKIVKAGQTNTGGHADWLDPILIK